MEYDVTVQGKPYKRIEAEYTNNVLTQVTLDIQNGLVPGFDPKKPQMIKSTPVVSGSSTSADA